MRGKRSAEKRLREIKVRLNDAEFEKLMEETARSGLSREDFCRRILAGAEVTAAHPEDLSRAIVRLRDAEQMIIRSAGRNGMELDAGGTDSLLMTLYEAEKDIAASCG